MGAEPSDSTGSSTVFTNSHILKMFSCGAACEGSDPTSDTVKVDPALLADNAVLEKIREAQKTLEEQRKREEELKAAEERRKLEEKVKRMREEEEANRRREEEEQK